MDGMEKEGTSKAAKVKPKMSKAEAYAKYAKVRDRAWAEYKKVVEPAYAEYKKRCEGAEE